MPFLRRFRQTVQTRYALTELVREENNEEQGHKEDQNHYQDEDRIGSEGFLDIIFERKSHTDDISAV